MDLGPNHEQPEELPWPRCFNCFHHIIKPKSEPLDVDAEELPTCTVDSEGNLISVSSIKTHQNSSNKPSCLNRLVYAFELQPSAIEALIRAVGDESDVDLCDSCNVLLTSMYTARQLFLQATSQESSLLQILNSDRTAETDTKKQGVKRKSANQLRHKSGRSPTKSRRVSNVVDDSSWEPNDGNHFQDQHHHDSDSDPRNALQDGPQSPQWIIPATSQREETSLISSMRKQAVVLLERIDAARKLKPGPRSRCIKLKNETECRSIRETKLKPSNSRDAEKSPVTRSKREKSAKKSSTNSAKIGETKSTNCPKCGKIFSSAHSVNKHLEKNACNSNKSRLAAPDQPDTPSSICYTFTCPICGNPSLATGGGRLEQHLRTHMNADERAKELICCSIHHKTLKDLGLHRKSAQCTAAKVVAPLNRPNAKKMSMCPVCGKIIYSVVPSALKHHMDLVHARVSNYVCNICGRPCPNNKTLREHELTHLSREDRQALKADRVRSQLCQLCGKAFYKKEHLRQHANKVHKIAQPGVRRFMEVVKAQSELEESSKTEPVEIVPYGSLQAQPVGEVEAEHKRKT